SRTGARGRGEHRERSIRSGALRTIRRMRLAEAATVAVLLCVAAEAPVAEESAAASAARSSVAAETRGEVVVGRERLGEDLEAMRKYRPGYRFWSHVFSVPDGHIAFGSATDGKLLATFPAKGDWLEGARWGDSEYAQLFDGQRFDGSLNERREETARLLAEAAGPVVHHSTRGTFIEAGTKRFGTFLSEWGRIFERFGVPAEIGLA